MKCIITYRNDLKGSVKSGYIVKCDDIKLEPDLPNFIKFTKYSGKPILIVNFDAVESIEIVEE